MPIRPEFNTMLFNDVFPTSGDFVADIKDTGLPNLVTDISLNTIYYLLFARYGNNPIANLSIEYFKLKVAAVIHQFGPTWEKKMEIQKKLRDLSDDDLLVGAKNIYNHASNPSTTPTTGSLEELDYINDQTTQNVKRGKIEGYERLLELLEDDVTENFIIKFRKLFKTVVEPERTLLYEEI